MNGYYLAFSPQDIGNRLGISKTRIYEAVKALKEKYYICEDGKNHLQFFVKPNPEYGKNHSLNNWENPKMENKTPIMEQKKPKTDQIFPKTCIEIDNKDKIDNIDKDNNKSNDKLNLLPIAEELEGILFNKDASTDDWETISRIIDTEAYNRAERQFFAECDRNEQKLRENCINYVIQLLQNLSDEDKKIVCEIVKRYINQEGI